MTVTPGDGLPEEFNAVIEIPSGSSIKYELDKAGGLIKTATSCPAATKCLTT